MSSSPQFQFSAEFVTFLASAAGLALVLLRGEHVTRSWWARLLLGAGFVALGTSAFFSGSRIIEQETPLLVLRLAGVGLAALGSQRWAGTRLGRILLSLGLALVAVSALLDISDDTDFAADLTLMLGAVAIDVSVLAVSRRSVAARVAASAAGVLLLMVLVLSLSLSTVVSDTVEEQALLRLGERAQVEAALIENRSTDAILAARLAGQALANAHPQELRRLFAQPQSSSVISDSLATLSAFVSDLPLLYLSTGRTVLAQATGGKLSQADLAALAGSEPVAEALDGPREVGAVAVLADRAMAVGVFPVLLRFPPEDTRLTMGATVGVALLDDAYLNVRSRDNPDLSLALVTRNAQLARDGRQPPSAAMRRLAARSLADGQPHTAIEGGRFITAQPVARQAGDDLPVVALVAATPTTVIDNTRDDLFRTLFLIALGGTLIALFLAAFVGERIGASLRRLTLAAEAIRRGDLNERADVASDDEVGVLGEAFNSMAASIEEKTVELRQAADDEARLRNRLEAVVAGMGEALVAVDAQGRITDFNRSAEELLAVDEPDARGRYADAVISLTADDGTDLSPRLRKPLVRRWESAATVGQPDGTEVPVVVTAGALRGPTGEMAGGVFVLRDLRREREVERMKTEFLSHIGHELRTPLAGVIGFAEILLRREITPARARPLHRDILTSAKQLERIVEMLEFFASAGAGRAPLRRERIDIRTIVDDVVERWSGRVGAKHSISKRVGRATPEVFGDRRWLTHSLEELVDNAVKFSPEGGRISVTAGTNGTGGEVEISVVDHGKGMTADERARAFGEFVQGDGSDTRVYGGLGLGLAMVKRVAEAHGGTVVCESQPRKGSKFSILLPAMPKNRRGQVGRARAGDGNGSRRRRGV